MRRHIINRFERQQQFKLFKCLTKCQLLNRSRFFIKKTSEKWKNKIFINHKINLFFLTTTNEWLRTFESQQSQICQRVPEDNAFPHPHRGREPEFDAYGYLCRFDDSK